jgi:hypothetical protein
LPLLVWQVTSAKAGSKRLAKIKMKTAASVIDNLAMIKVQTH